MMAKSKNVGAWKAEPLMERLYQCKMMLVIHGLLTDAESQRLNKRLRMKEDRERRKAT